MPDDEKVEQVEKKTAPKTEKLAEAVDPRPIWEQEGEPRPVQALR